MTKTLIGIGTFGLKEFTELTVNRIRETVKSDYQIFCVVGKPDDVESEEYFKKENISYVKHDKNWGFPVAVNDIYDYGWVHNDFDYVIIMGNDVLPYPYAIDSMIKVADTTDYEWICGNQYDVRSLCRDYPEANKYFSDSNYIFKFQGDPWNLFTRYSDEIIVADIPMSDVQNLCLYKKSVFEKIGYTDPNFWPAYYIDNDYARRGVNASIKSCTLPNSIYFHFWSRVIHQGSGGSNHRNFENNRRFYVTKWGNDFGFEKYTVPFDGKRFLLGGYIPLKGSLKIESREQEKTIAEFWMRY